MIATLVIKAELKVQQVTLKMVILWSYIGYNFFIFHSICKTTKTSACLVDKIVEWKSKVLPN